MATAQVAPATPIEKRGYAHPEKLVSTDWVAQHLKDPKVESVASMVDLMKDPLRTPYNIEILAPDIEAAQALADKLGKLPEVNMVLTANSFVPKDQEAKLAIIQDLNDLMGLSLDPLDVAAPPTA